MLFALQRILIVLVVAIAAYCLWPRSTSLEQFPSDRMAELQVTVWQKTAQKDRLGMIFPLYEMYERGYRIPPITALNMARTMSHARNLFVRAADAADQDKALDPLRTTFTNLKNATGAAFDANAAARLELHSWQLVADHAKRAQLTTAISEQLGLFYGRPAAEMLPAAKHFARAMKEAGDGRWEPSLAASREAWAELGRIVAVAPKT
ncbi:MAG: hypothetical protein SFU53_16200 [Terrimicrobiaceae bacterium]|nr:hypothetical protein [Terrimicrobiaceae bacterium]